MKILIFGRPSEALALVALADLAKAAGAKPVWRDPKYFSIEAGQYEPADAAAIDGEHPRAGDIASALDAKGVPVAQFIRTATPAQVAEWLRYGIGLGLKEPDLIDGDLIDDAANRCLVCGFDVKACECPAGEPDSEPVAPPVPPAEPVQEPEAGNTPARGKKGRRGANASDSNNPTE